jgi:hypothetical protein
MSSKPCADTNFYGKRKKRSRGELYERYDKLITLSNELRGKIDDDRIMALLGFFQSRGAREKHTGNPEKPAESTAYIIRQLKRPEEIVLFREVYGRQVFQISAYADPDQRKLRLASKMRDHDSSKTRTSEFEPQALQLVNRDEHEFAVTHGQRLRALSRSWVLLVNRAGRSQPTCFNALGHSTPSQISSEIAYSWPM